MASASSVHQLKGLSAEGMDRHDSIHFAISEAIVEHRLMPGVRLREDALAEVFGVSRTGIRKVLQRLALERLVTIAPRRGAAVSRPSAEEAREVFAARGLVEGALVDPIADAITAQDSAALRALIDEERQAQAAGRQSVAIKASASFHTRLAQAARNEPLADFIGQLASRSSLIIAVYGSPLSIGCDCGDHQTLLELIERGEKTKARRWLKGHLQRIEATLSFSPENGETPDLRRIFATER